MIISREKYNELRKEIERLNRQVGYLEGENDSLRRQLERADDEDDEPEESEFL
jgi:hypothetical protein